MQYDAGMLNALFACLLAQEFTTEDRFGKSVDDVVAMGRDKWHEWYTHSDRGGGSTAGESFAQMIYADCLKVKNDAHLALAKGPKEILIHRLDPFFTNAMNNCTDAGRALTGGGTMWNIIHSGCQADKQETVRDLIWPRPKMPRATQSDVWKASRQALKALSDNKEDIDTYGTPGSLTYESAVTSLHRVNDEFYQCVRLVANEDDGFKGRTFAFYAQMLKVVQLGE